MPILERVDWELLDRIAERQQRNREVYSPVVSLFRWWARRPHAVMGAILDAACEQFRSREFVVSDPFSGGGTVAFEAARRGLAVYAQDLYPWPTLGLATALLRAEPGQLEEAGNAVLKALSTHRSSYRSAAPGPDTELSHVIRVREVACLSCSESVFLFRTPLVSLASRRTDEAAAFYGCLACGTATRASRDSSSFSCSECKMKVAAEPLHSQGSALEVVCPHCGTTAHIGEMMQCPPRWRPVLVQAVEAGRQPRPETLLRPPVPGDGVWDVEESPEEHALQLDIPPGEETNHLRQQGFCKWSELYTHRQLQAILAALREVEALPCPGPVKDRLRLAVLAAAEMPGYLCRWDRYHPKAFEAVANHRYSRQTVVVETNLLSPVGRGTIPKRLAASLRALKWMGESGLPRTVAQCQPWERCSPSAGEAVVCTGTSGRQALPDGAARLILTDPPYHDDVQYGELSRIFHVWMTAAGLDASADEDGEAAPNAVRGTQAGHYENTICACLAEASRTLAPKGSMVFTFHNNRIEAWTALRNALIDAGFTIVGLATVTSENGADHSKRRKRAFVSDLVVECKPGNRERRRPPALRSFSDTNGPERANLLAMGRALARTVNTGKRVPLAPIFERELQALGESERLVR